MKLPIQIDPDIRRARTLPAWCYRDKEFLDLVRDRVFARSWQLVGHDSDVESPGDVAPIRFLDGMIGEPMLLVRGEDGEVRCLSNVCTHRGMIVCPDAEKRRRLQCGYHGRTFDLDGKFRAMPEFDGAVDFPSPADDLARFPLERLGPFLFTAIDPAFPADAFLSAVAARAGGIDLRALAFDEGRSRDYEVAANWALYVDNYLEGFHIPYVHKGLDAVLDDRAYQTEPLPYGVLQVGMAGEEEAALYFWLFPNLMLNVYPWGLSINVVRPVAVDKTIVEFRTWVGDATKLDQGAGAALDVVELEDEAVVEAVQQGVGSRVYSRGRYSPSREPGVHHFHRLLAAAVATSAGP